MRVFQWIMPLGCATLLALAGCGGDDETKGSSSSSGTGGTTSGTGGSSSGTGGTGGSSSGTGGTGGSSSGTGGSSGGTGGTGGSCVAPDAPSGPVPDDAATGVDPDATTAVSWTDSGADSYDVYLGDVCPPPSYPDAAFQTVNAATLDALTLTPNTSYCWQVVAVSADPSCYAEGPVWGFDTGCNDAVAGAPAVTSGDAVFQPGTTAGTYTLTFSEVVYDVAANVTWTPVVGTGTLDAVTDIDGQSYSVDFSGVGDGDLYTLTVDTGVTDYCGNAVVAQVDIAISVVDVGLTCAQATDLTYMTLPFQLMGTYDDDPTVAGTCDSTPTNAVWYTYTAPADGWYDIAAVNATTTNAWSRLAVFEGTGCNPLGTEIECVTQSAKTVSANVELVQGTSYLIVFFTDGDTYTMIDPVIDVTPIDVGDECAAAIDVTNATFPYQVPGTFGFELDAGGSCDTTPTNMVWFTYTAPSTAWYDIALANGATTGGSRVVVYEGASCNPLGTELDCATSTGTAVATALPLTQGQTYAIAFYTSGNQYAMVDPEISIAEITFAAGEECTAPIDVSAETFPYQVTGTFDYEFDAGGSCDTTPNNMVWFSYTPTTSDWYSISVVNSTATSANTRLAVWEGPSCNPQDAQVACVAPSSKTATASPLYLTQGITYLIAAYTNGETYTMVDPSITIAATTPVAGEVCATAADVSAVTFPYQLTGTFDNELAAGGSCDTTPNNMVWFSYTPSSSDWYSISVVNSTATNAYTRLAVWEGPSCNPYDAQVTCVAPSSKTATASPLYLTQGVTYLIAAYTDGETFTMVDPSITIATTTPPVPGEACVSSVDLSAVTFPYQLTGTFGNDAMGGTCDPTATNIVWYTFTPTVTQSYTISAQNYTATAAYSRLAIFETASCSPYGAQVACATSSNKTPSTTVTLTQGVTYLILFYTDGDSYTMIDPSITITP